MKRSFLSMLMVVVLALVAGAAVYGQTSDNLDSQGATINSQASSDAGAAAIVQAIEAMFGVTSSQITTLQADNLGYGEIVILLSLAQTMSGGLTTANIDSVLASRQGPPVQGWGQIAQALGVNLGKVVSSVVKVAARSQAILKAQSASENGKGNGQSGGASSGAGSAGAGHGGSGGSSNSHR